MMEATSTSETSVNFYYITRRNNPEGSYLHNLRSENLKSHLVEFYLKQELNIHYHYYY
jgi:hypothetical protein